MILSFLWVRAGQCQMPLDTERTYFPHEVMRKTAKTARQAEGLSRHRITFDAKDCQVPGRKILVLCTERRV